MEDNKIQEKQKAMLDRLSNRHKSRLQQSSSSSSSSFESIQSFIKQFSESQSSIQSNLRRPSLTKLDLEETSKSISNLEELVSLHSYFLPSYDLRSSLKTIEDLKQMLESLNSQIAPRKKFSFKSRVSSKKIEIEGSDVVPNAARLDLGESPGFRNRKGEILLKNFGDSDCEGDFSIVDLDSCDVYLKGRFKGFFVHRIRNCRVFVGPVLGSILIEEVKDCSFMLASHQIRIHDAKKCDFYLRVRSRPIVEDCSGVRFAPYRLFYHGIEKDLSDSGLEEETRNWANVDDFLWLRNLQSPNWCLIPEEEFVDVIDVSQLEEKTDDN